MKNKDTIQKDLINELECLKVATSLKGKRRIQERVEFLKHARVLVEICDEAKLRAQLERVNAELLRGREAVREAPKKLEAVIGEQYAVKARKRQRDLYTYILN